MNVPPSVYDRASISTAALRSLAGTLKAAQRIGSSLALENPPLGYADVWSYTPLRDSYPCPWAIDVAALGVGPVFPTS